MLTIKDIAREFGISISSVSRALNDHPNICPATRARVLDACRRLNYVPNVPARSLVHKSSHTIGLMMPDIADSLTWRENWRPAARMVCDILENGVLPVSRALKTTLIRRGSTGPVCRRH